ncbi:MAG: heavy metal translocating P-type ATPase [Beijerinckiaceae bacterium]
MVDSLTPILTLDITGMHCSGCAGTVEKALERIAGAGNVTVNVAMERADIRGSVDAAAAVAAVEAAGYGAAARAGTAEQRLAARERLAADRRASDRLTFALMVLAILLLLPFLVDMGFAMAGFGHGYLLSPWVQLALAIAVQFMCGWRFLKGAAKAVMRGMPNMDVLVALGTLAAFGFSAWRVLTSGEHAAHEALYFEGAVAIIAFVLLGKVLEANARTETTDAMTLLERERVVSVLVFRDAAWVTAQASTLKTGDFFAVRPGERAAADGVVSQGQSEMDESLVTGESVTQFKAAGAKVVAGALNSTGMLTVEASAVGEDTTLARIARLVDSAQTSKAPAQQLADRISRIFVPAVLVIAAVTAAVWFFLGYRETALIAAISVLVVSCPCALGLATPVALVAGTGAAAKSGILVRDIAALEAASAIDIVAFDKTGTLTEGRPRVAAISAPGVGPEDALKLALSLALGSEHPMSLAIKTEASDRDLTAEPALNIEAVPGMGVKGDINGVKALLGSAEFIRTAGISLGVLEQVINRDPGFSDAQSVSWLAGAGRVIGAFAFVDGIRSHAEQAIANLKAQGLEVVMLSGDKRGAAQAIAGKLGIVECHAALKPADKVQVMRSYLQAGKHVAMVGDGLNDTPVLAAATLGIAMGTGTDAARAAAGISLLRSDLRLIPRAIEAARATRAVIRQNLWFAFVFNSIGIPLAAFGMLTPTIAGAAMAASSLFVVFNALRLSRRNFG